MLTTAALAPCAGPTGTRGRDRGTTRHACAAPLRLGSIWAREVRCRVTGTDPVDPAAGTRRPFERGLCPRNLFRGELSEGAIEAPSERSSVSVVARPIGRA